MTCVARALYNTLHGLSLPVLMGVTVPRVRAHISPLQYFRQRWSPPPSLPRGAPDQRTVWVHAVSVGEVLTALPLLHELQHGDSRARVVLSTVTPAGYQVARDQFSGPVFYLPLDLAPVVNRFLSYLQPRLFVAMETEIWPELFFALRRRGVPIVIANGRISDASFPRYRRIRFFLSRVLACVDRVGAQSPEHAERFCALGAPPDRVVVTGNLKFDSTLFRMRQGQDLPWLPPWRNERPLVVFGSWLAAEWDLLQATLVALHAACPEAAILVAPRHIHHAPVWWERLRARGLPVGLRSRLDPAPIWILDTYGELAAAYRHATIAVIGGSFRPGMAGHNPIEPASFGVPVVMGPYHSSFRDVVRAFRERDGIVITPAPDLVPVVVRGLQDPAWRRALGQRARATVSAHQGATQRILALVQTVQHMRIDKVPGRA